MLEAIRSGWMTACVRVSSDKLLMETKQMVRVNEIESGDREIIITEE